MVFTPRQLRSRLTYKVGRMNAQGNALRRRHAREIRVYNQELDRNIQKGRNKIPKKIYEVVQKHYNRLAKRTTRLDNMLYKLNNTHVRVKHRRKSKKKPTQVIVIDD